MILLPVTIHKRHENNKQQQMIATVENNTTLEKINETKGIMTIR
jgi:hypothetical protein